MLKKLASFPAKHQLCMYVLCHCLHSRLFLGYQLLHHLCEIVLPDKCMNQSAVPFSPGTVIFMKAMEPHLGQNCELHLYEMCVLVVCIIVDPSHRDDLIEPAIHF